MAFDYSDEQPVTGDNEFTALSTLVDDSVKAKEDVDRLELELKKAKTKLRDYEENQIPELMKQLTQKRVTTANGVEVELTEKVRASIPKANKEEGTQWLQDNGFGALVGRKIVIEFKHDEQAWAKKFQSDMAKRKKPLRADINADVHAARLSSWAKARLEEGIELPMKLLGIFKQDFAKITPPKKED